MVTEMVYPPAGKPLYTIIMQYGPKMTPIIKVHDNVLSVTQENRVNYNQRNYQDAFSQEQSKDALHQSKEQLSIFDLVTVQIFRQINKPSLLCSHRCRNDYFRLGEQVSKWVEFCDLRPARHVTGHLGDESFQAFTCTGTGGREQKLVKSNQYTIKFEI